PQGSFEYYDCVRWLSFVATELHKRVNAQIFAVDGSPDTVKEYARVGAARPLGVLDQHLKDRSFVSGDSFSVADAYLTWALTLFPTAGVPLDGYPVVRAYQEQQLAREHVRAAFRMERSEYKLALSVSAP